MNVYKATEMSIAGAVKNKTLDRKLQAGPIAALLRIAEQLDHPDFPIIDGRLDNVSLPTYLRYCDALNLTPTAKEVKKTEAKSGNKLGNLRSVHAGKTA